MGRKKSASRLSGVHSGLISTSLAPAALATHAKPAAGYTCEEVPMTKNAFAYFAASLALYNVA